MKIDKKQNIVNNYKFNWKYYNSARQGFKQLLISKNFKSKRILLPAYIGYSKNEGSGVFDPIEELNIDYIFYHLNSDLSINKNDLENKIKLNKDNVLLIIHYFGFYDENLKSIKKYASNYNMAIIEDYAHAFFTFYLNPVFDLQYGIFSIHKMFPFKNGGLVLSKDELNNDTDIKYNIFNYDIISIANKRIENYLNLLKIMSKCAGKYNINILRSKLNGQIPHNFPILLPSSEIRDHLYFQLNKEGYGVISLYNELIDKIGRNYSIEKKISSTILNLPVHQDVNISYMKPMIDRLLSLIK